jgi:hypothetical protein
MIENKPDLPEKKPKWSPEYRKTQRRMPAGAQQQRLKIHRNRNGFIRGD